MFLILAGITGGCVRGLPTWSTEFAAQRGDFPIEALPVDVIDLTGLVEGVIAVKPGEVTSQPGVSVVRDALRVEWVRRCCESRVRLIFRPDPKGGYLLKIDSDTSSSEA